MINNSVQELNSFEILSENEMMEVRGGTDIRPRTRDIDVYDEESE